MNVFFLTIENIYDLDNRSIYSDLINEFISYGHYVTVASVCEARNYPKKKTSRVYISEKCEIVKIYSANITKNSNYISKGIGLLKLYFQSKKVAKKAIKEHNYDLVVYASPPVTIFGAAELIKQKQNAFCYLLLKDIWPYDCRFEGILEETGWKKIAFEFLKILARKMYTVSDKIGCMSEANIQYLIENEPNLDRKKIEINPNSIKPYVINNTNNEVSMLRKKYEIPSDKVIFVYGGNLGQAQGIDFAIESIHASGKIEDAFFVFVGSGTEQDKVIDYVNENKPNNFLYIPSLEKNEYEKLVYGCDVGLVYLNSKCLAPNFPSRILSYMQASKPIIFATDRYTDVGKIAVDNGFGKMCESTSTDDFVKCVEDMLDVDIRGQMGKNANDYLNKYFTVECSYRIIMDSVLSNNK